MSIWIAAASAAINALGKVKQGRDAKGAADQNAANMRAEAEYTQLKEALDLAKYKENVKKSMAQTNLAYAKNGVRGTSGSVIDVRRENLNEALYDAEMIKLDSLAKQRGIQGAIQNYERQGQSAMTSGLLGAAGSAISFLGNNGGSLMDSIGGLFSSSSSGSLDHYGR